MDWIERASHVAKHLAQAASGGVVLAGGVLWIPVFMFAREGDWLLSGFWLAASLIFVVYGVLSLAALWAPIPAAVRTMISPIVKLGAIAIVLAGAAWFIVAVNSLHHTAHFEGYPFVFGLLMATQGTLMFWVLEQSRPRQTLGHVA